jgi:hypothetical protein
LCYRRSILYYLLLHNGMASIKFIGSQARSIHQYKNIRTKILKVLRRHLLQQTVSCQFDPIECALVTPYVFYSGLMMAESRPKHVALM